MLLLFPVLCSVKQDELPGALATGPAPLPQVQGSVGMVSTPLYQTSNGNETRDTQPKLTEEKEGLGGQASSRRLPS